MVKLLALLPLIAGASAHISFWHPSMYGYNVPKSDPHWPVSNLRLLNFKDWWFHGNINQPPAEGQFFELPAGGKAKGQLGCGKGQTTFGGGKENEELACVNNQLDALHSGGGVKGCAVAIAYESDVHKIQPDDFRVVTVNHECPYRRDVEFEIPKGLPPCPPGGCHCAWLWIHSKESGVDEMYFTGFKCKVKDADVNAPPLPKPYLAKKCVGQPGECVKALKQPMYWMQLEGNNMNNTAGDPPLYNMDYGFTNGAQDLWAGTGDNGGETPSAAATSILSSSDAPPPAETPDPRPSTSSKVDPITSGQGPDGPSDTALPPMTSGTASHSYTRGSGYDDAGHTLPSGALHAEPTVPAHDGKGNGSPACRARKRSRAI